ncbi:endonuclease [Prolixibacteraceae bacterium JC049]|nr:endonuclease [Prolixibacteraceae bacterium JC049]
MRKLKAYILVILLFYCCSAGTAQNNTTTVVFYNVENFFDTEDDPHTLDNEFLSDGIRKWNNYRFKTKRNHIFKTLLAIGNGTPPDIIGLCEIENRYCLEQLIRYTPLRNFNYRIIHKESPDKRGIDVALLYRKDKFTPLDYAHFPVITSDKPKRYSRDILYTKGIINNTDTIHFFVNHWPSRYRGLMESKPLRVKAANILKLAIDSVSSKRKHVIVMGDFNDTPTEESMQLLSQSGLINLSNNWQGTLKHKAYWNTFDQFLISPSIQSVFQIQANVIRIPFLLTEDKKFLGQKPFRTYIGFKYQGGFSDHLPIKLVLIKNGIQ